MEPNQLGETRWEQHEDSILLGVILESGPNFDSTTIPGRTSTQCSRRWKEIKLQIRSELNSNNDAKLFELQSKLGDRWDEIANLLNTSPNEVTMHSPQKVLMKHDVQNNEYTSKSQLTNDPFPNEFRSWVAFAVAKLRLEKKKPCGEVASQVYSPEALKFQQFVDMNATLDLKSLSREHHEAFGHGLAFRILSITFSSRSEGEKLFQLVDTLVKGFQRSLPLPIRDAIATGMIRELIETVQQGIFQVQAHSQDHATHVILCAKHLISGETSSPAQTQNEMSALANIITRRWKEGNGDHNEIIQNLLLEDISRAVNN